MSTTLVAGRACREPMAAGKKSGGGGGARATRAPLGTAAAAAAAGTEAEAKWVERPMEPVVSSGRGMHVLGFVSLQGLKAEPIRGPPASEEGQKAATHNGKRGHDGYTSLQGNYHRYYGYRHGAAADALDQRLAAVLGKLGERCFEGKEVLDVGCNAGEVSLAVGRRLGARRVVGVDVDAGLIEAAEASCGSDGGRGSSKGPSCKFEFRAEDFLESPLKRPPSMKPERFDFVLCFSVTKWVHFVYGDPGVRNLFRRCLKRLKPGGILVLEPQEWQSYKKKRHLTPEIRQMVATIEMPPQAFGEFLKGLGMEHLGTLDPPSEGPKGFRRPIHLYRRPGCSVQDPGSAAPAAAAAARLAPAAAAAPAAPKAAAEASAEHAQYGWVAIRSLVRPRLRLPWGTLWGASSTAAPAALPGPAADPPDAAKGGKRRKAVEPREEEPPEEQQEVDQEEAVQPRKKKRRKEE